jgi:hypothetical protein
MRPAAAALDDNRRAVDEAAARWAPPCLVLVVGGLPGALQGEADLDGRARRDGADGIAAIAADARRAAGMPLAIEPLHPM